MPPSRSIADFFKRPSFALNTPESPTNNDRPRSSIDSPTTSPLTEPPSSSLSNHASPPSFNLPIPREDKPQVKKEDERPPQPSFQSADSTVADNSTRRMINGKEVVISSDGEDTDSIASLESPEELFAQLGSGPKDAADKKSGETQEMRLSMNDVKPSKFNAKNFSVPNYKNTLDVLVTDAVDDNQTEASIAKIRATIKLEEESTAATGSDGQDKQLHEGMLTSALGDKDDELGLQRLLDAVRRTEAFDHEKAWSFFSNKVTPPPAPKFPRDSVAPGTYLAVLREPGSRERAFHSGIVDFALSKQFLPDELVTWIFHSVPAEPRDELRQVYCRVFKHATAERVRSLIRPNDIDLLFQRLGATPKALALREPVSPDPPESAPDTSFNNQKPLLSLLELLRGAADLFAHDTRERILVILFRLTIDVSLMKDTIVCSEVERTITTVLEAIPEDGTDDTVHRICTSLYDTIEDPAFQSRLLKHTLPTSSWISLLRCRLAVAYLTRDPTPLTEPPESVLDLKRMTQVLRNRRFDVKLYKGKGCAKYDYGELGSIITLLNIAIDPGWAVLGFPSKDAEKAFNAEIDVLADRIKKIFTSIEDSGVSHLKRTLAKEGLEALHYRVLYSVRSKPQPRKVGFQVEVRENNGNTMNNYFGRTSKEGGNLESPVKDEGESS